MEDYKEPTPDQPVCCIVIGMAGSGKTTLMKVFSLLIKHLCLILQRLSTFMTYNDKNAYVVNLDPAVSNLPYIPNIDIRDTVDYKGVMKEYVLFAYVNLHIVLIQDLMVVL